MKTNRVTSKCAKYKTVELTFVTLLCSMVSVYLSQWWVVSKFYAQNCYYFSVSPFHNLVIIVLEKKISWNLKRGTSHFFPMAMANFLLPFTAQDHRFDRFWMCYGRCSTLQPYLEYKLMFLSVCCTLGKKTLTLSSASNFRPMRLFCIGTNFKNKICMP